MKLRKFKPLISFAVMAFLSGLIFLDPFWLFEYRLQDSLYQEPGWINPDIVVIGIDEKALSRFGAFQQWSRRIMADAILILNGDEDGLAPAVIAIDILYTEEGADKEADAALAEAAEKGGNVVLASHIVIGQDLSLNRIITDYQKPFPLLEPRVDYGLVNSIFDRDGVVRNILLKESYCGEYLYGFAVSIARKFTGNEPGRFIEENEAFINYSGYPGDYYEMSFADIFEEDFEPAFFAGAIVFIGYWATGMMDAYLTPMSQGTQYMMYGVEIHANAVQMMLDAAYKRRVPDGLYWVIILALLFLCTGLGELLDIRVVLGIFAALGIAYIFAAKALYDQGAVLPLLYPLMVMGLIFVYQLIFGYIVHAMEKAHLRGIFKKYADPKRVEKLIESGEAHSDEVGSKRPIAILFVDVRGFTPIMETLRDQPELVVKILNEYLELTVTAVFDNGGSVDKFIGDASMALFNGFVPLEDYVYKAVKAAWDMVQGAEKVNASIKEKYGIDVGFGIGVSCGEAIVGNLGPSFRKDYTAIGDPVNTAARLESSAKRSQILISKNVYDALRGRIKAESIGEIPLKGKSIPVEVFEVTGLV